MSRSHRPLVFIAGALTSLLWVMACNECRVPEDCGGGYACSAGECTFVGNPVPGNQSVDAGNTQCQQCVSGADCGNATCDGDGGVENICAVTDAGCTECKEISCTE